MNRPVEGESVTNHEYVSWLWETSSRRSGVSWWGERPPWVRHLVYWIIALAILAISVFDRREPSTDSDGSLGGAAIILWFFGIMIIAGVVAIVREWDYVPVLRSLSRLVVVLVLLIGILALLLVILEADITEPATRRAASPHVIVDLLSWNAAAVVPGLEIPESLGWDQPGSSSDPLAGAAVIIVRAFVAVILLAGVKRLWDQWLGFKPPPARSDLAAAGRRLTHARISAPATTDVLDSE
jgi:hypothetical protein